MKLANSGVSSSGWRRFTYSKASIGSLVEENEDVEAVFLSFGD